MEPRAASALARFQSFLQGYTDLAPSSAAPLLVSFARGEATVCPPVSSSVATEDMWRAHEERAQIIAEFGLLHSSEEAEIASLEKSARLVAERRSALDEKWLAWGFEVEADALASDLTISLGEARAKILALRKAAATTTQTVEQRAAGQVEMGPTLNSPQSDRERNAASMASALDAEISGRKAGVKNA